MDVLIRRTLVYGATVAAIGAGFVAAALVLQAVFRPLTGGSDLAIADRAARARQRVAAPAPMTAAASLAASLASSAGAGPGDLRRHGGGHHVRRGGRAHHHGQPVTSGSGRSCR